MGKRNIYPRGWSDYVPPELPEWFNPTEVLDKNSSRFPDKVALIADDLKYTYRELLEIVNKTSNSLYSLGLRKEDRVIIYSSDTVNSLSLWLASIRAGLNPAWVPPAYTPSDLLYFVKMLSPKLFYTNLNERVKEVIKDAEEEVEYISSPMEINSSKYYNIDKAKERESSNFLPVKKHRDDICYFLFSGGTTGKPKIVVHSTSDFIHVPDRHSKFMGWTNKDIHYATSTKAFTHGIWPGVLIPLYNGATSIISSKRVNEELVINIIENYRPTILITVPTVLKWLINTKAKPDFSSLRMVVSASEPLPPYVQEEFLKLYKCQVYDSIGSSEVTYEWLSNREGENKVGSCGKPIYGVQVKLVDPETLSEINEPYKQGELWVKSETNLLFYWRNAKKTRETIIGEWVRTGDILYFDEEGFFHYVSRLDDLFKVHGMWVSPVDLEKVIIKNPAIKDVAVVPFKDKDGLTYPAAFIVLREGYSLTEGLVSEIREAVRSQLGNHYVPKLFKVLDELPRTPLQKLDRKKLRQLI
jgi:benzoate-CoA ligase